MQDFSSAEVAEMTGLSKRRIQQWAALTGKQKKGRDHRYTMSDVKKIKSQRGKIGRPRSKE